MIPVSQFTAIAGFGCSALLAAGPDAAPAHAEAKLLAEFSGYLQQLVDDHSTEAFAYAYFSPTETLVEIIRGEPITADSAVPLGTVSVVLNSLLIGAMEFKGVLDTDRPVRSQLTDFRTPSEAHTRAITLRHLLTMTSGLVDYADTLLPENAQPQDTLLLLRQAPYAAPPGTLLQANLTSPAAAGFIAAAIDSSSPGDDPAPAYRKALAHYLAEPLGLSATTAPGYGRFLPANGIQSSLNDLRTILQTELRDGMSPHGTRILSHSQAVDRRQPQRLADMVSVAHLGWQRQAHLRTEYLIAASYDDTSVAVIAISPAFRFGWVCLITPGGNEARLLAEDAVLSTVEVTRQLVLLRDPSLLTPPEPATGSQSAAHR